jgi:hypothetical protein
MAADKAAIVVPGAEIRSSVALVVVVSLAAAPWRRSRGPALGVGPRT